MNADLLAKFKASLKESPLWEPMTKDIYRTWAAVASDAYEMVDDDNEVAIEFCIDADRLVTFGNPETCKTSDLYVGKIVGVLSYPVALKWLAKEVPLI